LSAFWNLAVPVSRTYKVRFTRVTERTRS